VRIFVYTLFACITLINVSLAQVSGVVLSEKSEPVAFALIAAFAPGDSLSPQATAVSDENGVFAVNASKIVGSFDLRITSFGLADKVMKGLQLEQGKLDLGNVIMKASGNELEEFEFVEETDVVQLGIDKRVFNVEKQAVATGGSALDVLAGVPGITIDNDGGISIRGSSNVTILINGKPSALLGSGRKGLLDKIPASQVKSVEIISNPSAKYDPDGTAGIINIVLKKSTDTGTNGRLAANIGTNFNYGLSAQINHKTKNVLYSASYDHRYESRSFVANLRRTFRPEDTLYYTRQTRNGWSRDFSHVARVGIDWDMNKKNALGLSGSFLTNPRRRDNAINFFDFNQEYILTDRYVRNEMEVESRITYDGTLFYTHRFNDKGNELNITTSYSGARELDSNDVAQDGLNGAGVVLYENELFTRSIKPERFYVSTSQVDHILPIVKIKGKLESGLKAIIREIDTENSVANYDRLSDSFVPDDRYESHFIYNEKILSAYSQAAGKYKKISYQAGLRAEQALTTSTLPLIDSTYNFNYFSLFPSAFLTYEPKTGRSFSASYSRRINRPDLDMLSPLIDVNDLSTQRVGNPYLKPEYINSYELGFSEFSDKYGISLIGFYRNTTGAHQRVVEVIGENVVRVRFENLASNQSYGVEANVNWKPFKWWKLNVSGSWFYFQTNGENLDPSLTNNAGAWTTKIISNITFWKNADFQAFFNYRSNSVTVQGRMIGIPTLDLALRKNFLNDRLTVSMRLSDVSDTQRFNYIADTDELYANVVFDRQSRIFMAEVSWNFGKQLGTEKKKKPGNEGGRSGGGDGGM
jgi:outer membrane receptor protein involved in Fe transport